MIATELPLFRPPPALRRGVVQVWQTRLAAPMPEETAQLSAEERARAARFVRLADRERALATRFYVRRILGALLGAEPADLRFETGPHGKPALAGASRDIHFNLSHTQDLLLLAVALETEVGVDVEFIRPEIPWLEMARLQFPAAVVERLAALPPDEGGRQFFAEWTAHEARLKACGCGLGGEPDGRAWAIHRFTPAPGFAAAVATEDEDHALAFCS